VSITARASACCSTTASGLLDPVLALLVYWCFISISTMGEHILKRTLENIRGVWAGGHIRLVFIVAIVQSAMLCAVCNQCSFDVC
jgi:hypothetical protein